MTTRVSLAGRLLLASVAPLVATAAMAALAARWNLEPIAVAALAVAAGLPVALWASSRLARPWQRLAGALRDSVESYRAGDFSVRIAAPDEGELGALVAATNELGDVLSGERRTLRQRELLLSGALEASPAAVLLVGAAERILYANRAARILLHNGRRLDGRGWTELVAGLPAPLAEALDSGRDVLATVTLDDGEETFQISRRAIELDTRQLRLYQIRRLTAELRRQEAAGWKKAIRVIHHELRSGLAPIRSLAHSARTLGERGESARVAELLLEIDDAAAAIQRFVEGYSHFARLPEPRLETVELRGFLAHLARSEAFRLDGELPPVAIDADPAQLRQVLVNLVRNAREAGSPEGEVEIGAQADDRSLTLEVRDRGRGMDAEELARALVPFHSTKPDGGGLGLALCREILEAHGGDLRLAPREGGGLVVACRLPLAGGDDA